MEHYMAVIGQKTRNLSNEYIIKTHVYTVSFTLEEGTSKNESKRKFYFRDQ